MAKRKSTVVVDDDIADEPSLDALLKQTLQQLGGISGWDDLNEPKMGQLMDKQLHLQRQRLRGDAMVFKRCFASDDGRLVLEHLLNETLRKTAAPLQHMSDAGMLSSWILWREGQNSIVASIIEAMAFANNQEAKPRGEK